MHDRNHGEERNSLLEKGGRNDVHKREFSVLHLRVILSRGLT